MTAIALKKETNTYWEMIKDAGSDVKLALIQRLTDALVPVVAKSEKEEVLTAAEKRTLKAIKELESGKGTVCNSFEDYLRAVG